MSLMLDSIVESEHNAPRTTIDRSHSTNIQRQSAVKHNRKICVGCSILATYVFEDTVSRVLYDVICSFISGLHNIIMVQNVQEGIDKIGMPIPIAKLM